MYEGRLTSTSLIVYVDSLHLESLFHQPVS